MECGSLPNAGHGAFALAVPRWQAAYFCGAKSGTGEMAVASRCIHGGLRDSVVIPLVAAMAGGCGRGVGWARRGGPTCELRGRSFLGVCAVAERGRKGAPTAQVVRLRCRGAHGQLLLFASRRRQAE